MQPRLDHPRTLKEDRGEDNGLVECPSWAHFQPYRVPLVITPLFGAGPVLGGVVAGAASFQFSYTLVLLSLEIKAIRAKILHTFVELQAVNVVSCHCYYYWQLTLQVLFRH